MPFSTGCISPMRGVGGNRGVHRAAALLQDVDRDLRRQRLLGRRHAVLGEHG